MRIAILANDAASYVKPMAEGLERMLARLGVRSVVFYDGLARLTELPAPFTQYIVENGPDGWKVFRRVFKYLLREVPALARFIRQLTGFDVIVVVNTIPGAFLRSFFADRTLRWLFPRTPIVLYDVFYLPTRGEWGQWLQQGNPEVGILERGNWGLERYDWYLCASVVSEVPVPPQPQPCSVIGLDLDDGTLRPGDKTEFTAVIDFECAAYMPERAVQIQALEETNTRYVVLNGYYPIERIRQIYSRASIFFLAMRESFGLPICEAQACGSYILTPYTEWCPSHWLKSDLSRPGPGELSPNFVVYDNDKHRLIEEIERIKRSYDPSLVVDTFHQFHPQFFFGDLDELGSFVSRVRSHEISSDCHERHVVASRINPALSAEIRR